MLKFHTNQEGMIGPFHQINDHELIKVINEMRESIPQVISKAEDALRNQGIAINRNIIADKCCSPDEDGDTVDINDRITYSPDYLIIECIKGVNYDFTDISNL